MLTEITNNLLDALEKAMLVTDREQMHRQMLNLYVTLRNGDGLENVYVPSMGETVSVTTDMLHNVAKYVAASKRLYAIKIIHDKTGLGLRESKSMVDHLHPPKAPQY